MYDALCSRRAPGDRSITLRSERSLGMYNGRAIDKLEMVVRGSAAKLHTRRWKSVPSRASLEYKIVSNLDDPT
jgi:hypothetical protein